MTLFNRIFAGHQKQKTGFVLALGGGGGRGLAHLGVLEVLEEHHLKPDVIVGTSIGALFGAMYAVNPDARMVIRHAEEILASDLFNSIELPVLNDEEDDSWLSRLTAAAKQTLLYTKAATDTSFADTNALVDIAYGFCGGESFADAKIPLFITAVHFPGGECELFSIDSDVKLPCAIAASMAIPGVFTPVSIGDKKYVDGGVAAELPSKEAKMVARPDQLVVAVNVGARPRPDVEPANVYGMLDWSSEIKSLYLRRYSKEYADVVIEPLVSFTQWHDFSNPEQEIDRGRQAAYEQMPKLIKMLEGK
ncbi:NTE family protein [Mariprofundus aestuarium]|uniref:NTE family protein n=2 Tax=Mariprofundus aestuarium TaxID=1921086 RepID=A0A2K8KZK9_MARES|nr:NTE family protein [Mariprofundus aestuarium]